MLLVPSGPRLRGDDGFQVGAHTARAGLRRRDLVASGGSFVGREHETAILRDALTDTLAGRGRLVMLAGEPGIGKTRLAEEAALDAAANGVRVLWGRCWEGGGAPAFWPWIQLIRDGIDADVQPNQTREGIEIGLARIAQSVPELHAMLPLPGHAPAPASAPPLADTSRTAAPERFRLFDAITRLFKELAGTTPLMMLLDDLHAADEDSLVLLRFLARDLKQTRILLVATYREVEVRQSSRQSPLISEIGREGVTIPLRGLSLPEVADLVRRTAAFPVADDMISLLHQTTEGNPFFLDETVRLLIAERDLGRAHRKPHEFAVPDSVRAAIHRRIEALADRTKTLLTIASVIGREFDLAVLREVSRHPDETLIASLAEAAAHAVIDEPAGVSGTYRFAHSMIADVLRTDLRMSARPQLHQQVGAALERVYAADLGPHLAQIAHHYTQALSIGARAKALEYSRLGAERARGQLAFAEAVRLYGMALQALAVSREADEAQRWQVLIAMGEAQAQVGSLDDARLAFEAAAAAARRLGRSDLLARTALDASAWFGTFFTLDRSFMALVEEAFEATAGTDSPIRAALMATLAAERYWAGDRQRGLALSEDAVTLARRLGDPRALVTALWVQNQLRWGPENVDGRLASATEIAALAEAIGDHQRALRAHEMRFAALLEIGDMQGLEAETRAYEALAQKAGEQFGIVERFRAVIALLRGDFEHAERAAQELLAHAERRQDTALLACAQALLVVLAEERGRLDPAQIERTANALIAQSPALAAQYRVIQGFLHLACGRLDEAAKTLESLAQHDCAAIPRDWNWLDNMRGLTILCVALRDARHAAIVYDLLLPYADRNVTAGWGDVAHGSAALYLGLLARILRRFDDAQMHFERALQFNERMGARPAVARTQCEYARMLLRRRQAGDREWALQLLEESLATASTLGMKTLETAVHALLIRAEEARPPASPRGEDASSAIVSPAADTTTVPSHSGGAGSIDAVAAAAVADLRDLRAHAAPDGTVTILFTDMKDSAGLFDKLGDLRAHQILSLHNEIVRQQIALQKGFEVKSMGDGFMIAFSSARRGLLCAIGIQRAFAAYCERHPDTPIRIRIGLHVGELINLSADFFGKAVIVAARIASLAQGGEIIVSSTLRDLTESAGDLRFSDAGEVQLKGLSGTQRLHRVIW
jgi:class 3 adenylate cyclase/tetratricopeptide (TPR) repeat protein